MKRRLDFPSLDILQRIFFNILALVGDVRISYACVKLSCLADNMRWDRSDDSVGCVPSLIVRAIDPSKYDHARLYFMILG